MREGAALGQNHPLEARAALDARRGQIEEYARQRELSTRHWQPDDQAKDLAKAQSSGRVPRPAHPGSLRPRLDIRDRPAVCAGRRGRARRRPGCRSGELAQGRRRLDRAVGAPRGLGDVPDPDTGRATRDRSAPRRDRGARRVGVKVRRSRRVPSRRGDGEAHHVLARPNLGGRRGEAAVDTTRRTTGDHRWPVRRPPHRKRRPDHGRVLRGSDGARASHTGCSRRRIGRPGVASAAPTRATFAGDGPWIGLWLGSAVTC